MSEYRREWREVGRERGSPECPRRIKGKYSASRRHLTSVLPGRGISILKGSWSWSRSKRIPRILPSQLRPLPLLLLLLLLLYFFFLLLLLSLLPSFFRRLCVFVQLSPPQLSSLPLSTSFLTYSFSQSAVPAAAAISLSDKSQVVRHPERS